MNIVISTMPESEFFLHCRPPGRPHHCKASSLRKSWRQTCIPVLNFQPLAHQNSIVIQCDCLLDCLVLHGLIFCTQVLLVLNRTQLELNTGCLIVVGRWSSYLCLEWPPIIIFRSMTSYGWALARLTWKSSWAQVQKLFNLISLRWSSSWWSFKLLRNWMIKSSLDWLERSAPVPDNHIPFLQMLCRPHADCNCRQCRARKCTHHRGHRGGWVLEGEWFPELCTLLQGQVVVFFFPLHARMVWIKVRCEQTIE